MLASMLDTRRTGVTPPNAIFCCGKEDVLDIGSASFAPRSQKRDLGSLASRGHPVPGVCFLHFEIVFDYVLCCGPATLGQQVAAKEWLEVPVQNFIDIAHFDLGAMVLRD